MDKYDIKISDLAKQDILGIASYIRDELLEPKIAENMTLSRIGLNHAWIV